MSSNKRRPPVRDVIGHAEGYPCSNHCITNHTDKQSGMYVIGVDIGGSHITACVYNHSANALQQESLVYRKVNTESSRDEILREWADTITACRERLDVDIRGIGIAMPGPFNYYEGISLVNGVEKLQDLYGVNIRISLAERLGIAPSQIRFINDATAFSIAEAMAGGVAAYSRIVAITLGTGFGSSFLVSGKPVIDGGTVPDGGFLYNQLYNGELADDVFSTRGIKARYHALSGTEVQDVKTLCETVDHDAYAKRTFQEFGQNLGEFLYPYLSRFSAEALVVGGNIAKAFAYFGPAMTQKLPNVSIYVSQHGEQAAVIGSALLLDDDYYHSIEHTIKLMSTTVPEIK